MRIRCTKGCGERGYTVFFLLSFPWCVVIIYLPTFCLLVFASLIGTKTSDSWADHTEEVGMLYYRCKKKKKKRSNSIHCSVSALLLHLTVFISTPRLG